MDFTSILAKLGMHSDKWVSPVNIIMQVIVVILIGWLTVVLTKRLIRPVAVMIVRKTSFKWDDLMFDERFFRRLGLLLAPIAIRFTLSFIDGGETMVLIHRLIEAWIVIASVIFVSAILEGIDRIYKTFPVAKDRPIRIFVQLVIIFLWCAAIMVMISIFTGTSVTVLLGGLTAFAAVLMLIFQDSILGFVAGIQINSNDLVHVGDWIEMPGRGVDGDVLELGITTVKVQNWDMTIVTVPTHKLVQESFVNWRGMSESGGRRVKRSIYIDVNSIHYLTDAEVDKMRSSSLLNDYMAQKMAEIDAFNAKRESQLDMRHLTNVGTFREYLEQALANNPDINQNMTHMVRQLQSGPTGLPMEIYCFSARKAWLDYERVQADIFDHVFAVMELFGLRAYQYGEADYSAPPQKQN